MATEPQHHPLTFLACGCTNENVSPPLFLTMVSDVWVEDGWKQRNRGVGWPGLPWVLWIPWLLGGAEGPHHPISQTNYGPPRRVLGAPREGLRDGAKVLDF